MKDGGGADMRRARGRESWESLNTFRTQAQRGTDGVCMPEPEG